MARVIVAEGGQVAEGVSHLEDVSSIVIDERGDIAPRVCDGAGAGGGIPGLFFPVAELVDHRRETAIVIVFVAHRHAAERVGDPGDEVRGRVRVGEGRGGTAGLGD